MLLERDTSPSLAFILTFAVSIVTLILWRIFSSRTKPLPGPKGYPVIGNLFDIPPDGRQHEVYAQWTKKFGDIFGLNVLGTNILVLNSQEAATDLLEKKGSIYQNRPRLVFAGEVIGHGKGIGLIQGGHRLREMRKHLHAELGGRNAEQFANLEEKEAVRFLIKLLNDPENFRKHIRWFVGDIILKISYGYTVKEENDPFVDLAEILMANFSVSMATGAWIVDSLPFLRYLPTWFPGATFHKVAKEHRIILDRFLNDPYNRVKKEMAEGVAETSIGSRLISSHRTDTIEEEDCIKWTLEGLYAAGTDTTSSSLATFFLAMSMHPSVLKYAQEEIDTVTLIGGSKGQTRLPLWEDRERLPYINALIQEVLRWGIPAPLAIPHCVVKEDMYNGYRIPKGTIVIPNAWAILHDPERYPNPEVFEPERFLGSPETRQPDPRHTVFGYGRRVCPGMMLAEQSLFIAITRTLAVFDIKSSGELPSGRLWEGGLLSHPVPFNCAINPRSPLHAALIEQDT